MNTRTLLSMLSIAMVGLAILSSDTYAQGPGRNGGQRAKQMGQKLKEKLNLTDQQASQIKALREQFRKDNASSLQEIKALREQMVKAMKEKDAEKAKALREQLKTKMQSLKPAHQQLQQQIGAILTPEQRDMLEKLKQARREHRQDRREKWRDHHKGAGQNGGTQGGSDDLN